MSPQICRTSASFKRASLINARDRLLDFGTWNLFDGLPYEWLIGALGLPLTLFYYANKYSRTGFILGHIRGNPLEFAMVSSTIPLFALIGYMLYNERAYRKELTEFKNLTSIFIDIAQRDFAASVRLIRDGTKWLEGQSSKEEREKVVDLMREEIDRLEETTRDVPKLAGLVHGLADFAYTDLGKYIDDAVKDAKAGADEKGIEIKYDLNRTYTTWCSPAIKDMLVQLLANAVKHAHENSQVILEVTDEGSYWRMAVKDSGDGPQTNSGLGLAIAKKIVDLHRGSILVGENEPSGRAFYVSLPKRKF